MFWFVFFSTSLFALNQEGNLSVKVVGFENNKGQFIIKIFRREDDLFGDQAYRESKGKIKDQQGEITFENLAYGSYSIMAIHDEDNNGIMNHNFLGLPTENFAFSNDWNFSIFSGKPTFEKTSFPFLNRTFIVVLFISK